MNDITSNLRLLPDYARTSEKHQTNENYEKNENYGAQLPESSSFSFFSSPVVDRPKLEEAALYGPAGEIIRRLAPHTEADPAAMFVQLLVGLGSLIGPGAYFLADGARHHANLFAVITGRTAKARKGTSWARVKNVLSELDDLWLSNRVKSGVVSGEGMIEAFRDDNDKRLLFYEGEFAQVLQSMKREGSTVSAILRHAWDGVKISVLRRKDPIEVEGAHISLIGHITLRELHQLLTSVEISNGLANRCLWIYAEREKLLPEGSAQPDLSKPLAQLHTAVVATREFGRIDRTPSARDRWAQIYKELSHEAPGKLGEVLCRGEAQVMRLALLLALLDQSCAIECHHLEAAYALWDYCEASASWIFANTLLSPRAAKILEALKQGPLSTSQIHKLFANNASKSDIDKALAELGPKIQVDTGGPGGGKLVRLISS